MPMETDLKRDCDLENLVSATLKKFGQIDVLVSERVKICIRLYYNLWQTRRQVSSWSQIVMITPQTQIEVEYPAQQLTVVEFREFSIHSFC